MGCANSKKEEPEANAPTEQDNPLQEDGRRKDSTTSAGGRTAGTAKKPGLAKSKTARDELVELTLFDDNLVMWAPRVSEFGHQPFHNIGSLLRLN